MRNARFLNAVILVLVVGWVAYAGGYLPDPEQGRAEAGGLYPFHTCYVLGSCNFIVPGCDCSADTGSYGECLGPVLLARFCNEANRRCSGYNSAFKPCGCHGGCSGARHSDLAVNQRARF